MSLIELLVALTIMALVAGGVLSVLTQQQRFYRDAGQRIDINRELRSGASMLPMEIRPISSVGGDVITMSDDVFAFLSNYGSAVVCAKTAFTVEVPPTSLRKGLAAWYLEPQPGDVIAIFDDGDKAGASDDVWLKTTITDVQKSGKVCAASAFLEPSGETTEEGLRITVADEVPATVDIGAVVRLLRPVQYSIFQPTPGPGNNWYLGYADFDQAAGTWSPSAVVAGPFRPFDDGNLDQSGVHFRYFDENGNALTSIGQAASLARVDISMRAEGASPSALSQQPMRDTVLFRIALRNRQ